jgi:hypothetical protein
MSTLEDKKKTKFLTEIHHNRKFLLSLVGSIENILEEYTDLLELNATNADENNTVEDFKFVEKNMYNITSKFESLRQGIEMNKQNLVHKIEENKDWIENPIQKVEGYHRNNTLRCQLIRKVNEQLEALKKTRVAEPN